MCSSDLEGNENIFQVLSPCVCIQKKTIHYIDSSICLSSKHSYKLSTWGCLKSWSPALHGACASDEGVPQLPIHTSIRREF